MTAPLAAVGSAAQDGLFLEAVEGARLRPASLERAVDEEVAVVGLGAEVVAAEADCVGCDSDAVVDAVAEGALSVLVETAGALISSPYSFCASSPLAVCASLARPALPRAMILARRAAARFAASLDMVSGSLPVNSVLEVSSKPLSS